MPEKQTSLEGTIMTQRDWDMYEEMLGIKPGALEEEIVLNFGAGGSHLGRDLRAIKIDCTVIDLDSKFDPFERIKDDRITLTTYRGVRQLASFLKRLNSPRVLQTNTYRLGQDVLGMLDRDFIKGDGRSLPFADQVFDHVLALWSIYQVPVEDKEILYKELMRVGRILHIGPIFRNDYEILEKLSAESNYKIVACLSLVKSSRIKCVPLPFAFTSLRDYDGTFLIQPPKRDDAEITYVGSKPKANVDGGCTIILKNLTPVYSRV